VILASGLALLPLLTLVKDVVINRGESKLELGFDGLRQVQGTLLLVAGEGLLGAVVGTAIGWLTAVCRFPGRRWLRIAQLVPMAFPAYLLAASLIDWGSYRGLRIHGLGWAILLLTLANYSYVFLLSTESFSVSGRRLLEACRRLGVGPWRSFFRVALPIALPSIGAGIALSAMEVVNDLGAVRLLGVPSLSAGILDRWQVDGNPSHSLRDCWGYLVCWWVVVIQCRRSYLRINLFLRIMCCHMGWIFIWCTNVYCPKDVSQKCWFDHRFYSHVVWFIQHLDDTGGYIVTDHAFHPIHL
jgi:ABC-type Fe3+ transport system permease subunit